MQTLGKLLSRNILFGTLLCLLIVAAVIWKLSGITADIQNQHKQFITESAQQMLVDKEMKNWSSYLKKSHNYKALDISNLSGEKLYHYSSPSKAIALPMVQPEPVQFDLPNQQIKISYSLEFSKYSELALFIALVVVFSVLTICVLAAIVSRKHYQSFFKLVSNKIKAEFDALSSDNAPQYPIDIPELNAGMEKVKVLIEDSQESNSELQKEAYKDSLTQLSNRNRFIQFFQENYAEEGKERFGVLLISRCSELQTINQIHGYKEGDNYIMKVAKIIQDELAKYKGAEVFRLNSSDFASIIPNITLKEAENYAQTLSHKFNDFQQASDLDSVAYTGLVFIQQGKPLGELLALTDTAISVAQTQNTNAWFSQKDASLLNNPSANYGNQNWRQEIDSVIESQRLSLCVQPIQPVKNNSKMYSEVLARFHNSNEDILPTASFIAMAEKLDKIVAIDRLIVEKVLEEIAEKNLHQTTLAVNLSPRSVHDEHFLIWLERRLLRDQTIASRLVFEVTELGLQQNIKTSKRFIDMIHRAGARVTVERFGVGLTSFKFFKDLKPDFIKMDSTYTRDIDDDKNNQYFIRVMVDLAHRLSINVLAESVETLEEKHTLEQLFIDGCQGYFIGKPEPI